jgi:polyisoprenoid-binding protein YceI
MKLKNAATTGFLILVLILSAGFLNPAAAAETYKLDPAHTSVVFRIKHLGVAYVYGRFNGPTGSFVFDESSPSKNSIQMQVDAQNVDTAVQKRDNHLKSPDFFNAGEHPLITFKSTSVKKSGADTYEITGDLTLLGKTKPITVKARQTGTGKDPWGNFRRGFEASFTVNRSDFGMDFMMKVVADDVLLTVSVEGIRQ